MAFYAGQEHTLGKAWGLNYGITYTTALDHSYQRYYDPETDNLLPDNNMNSRRREQTLNVYDIALLPEKHRPRVFHRSFCLVRHTNIWNEWSLYPVANQLICPLPDMSCNSH